MTLRRWLRNLLRRPAPDDVRCFFGEVEGKARCPEFAAPGDIFCTDHLRLDRHIHDIHTEATHDNS